MSQPVVPLPLTRPIPVSVPSAYQTTTTTTEIDVLMQSPEYVNRNPHAHALNPISSTEDVDLGVSYLLSSASHSDLGSQPSFQGSSASLSSPSGTTSISGSTGTLSFITAGTPSVVTEDLAEVNGSSHGGGEYVMVSHRRKYSDQSVRSVGEGGVLFSTPDDKEWAEGRGEVWLGSGVVRRREVELAVEMDVEEESRSMPHDPKLVLYNLGSSGMFSFFVSSLTCPCCRLRLETDRD